MPAPASRPRVVFVCGDYQPSRDGVSAYTERLTVALHQHGVDAVVHGQRGWGPVGAVGAVRALRARSTRPDVVHVQFAPSAYGYRGGVGLLPTFLGRSRLAVTLHEYGWWCWQPRFKALWQRGEALGAWDRETLLLTPRADALITTNAAHAAVVRTRLPALAGRTTVVPIGPNLDVAELPRHQVRAAVRAELGTTPQAPVLVFFGFVHPVKGVEYLLEAVRTLTTRHPGLRLLVVGGFETLALRGDEARQYRGRIDAEVARHGLQAVVRVTDYLPEAEVSRLLQSADVAVLPFNQGVTLKSGSLLAALAHGLATVTTTADPADPTLVDGRHVLQVPTRAPAALEAAVGKLLDDPDLRAELGEGGRRLAERHGWDAIAAAHVEVYERLARDRVVGP